MLARAGAMHSSFARVPTRSRSRAARADPQAQVAAQLVLQRQRTTVPREQGTELLLVRSYLGFNSQFEVHVRAVYEFAPVIADVIAAHCPGTTRDRFLQACLRGDWGEARSMVEGMLAEPWLLRGYQEDRLRDFLELLPAGEAGYAASDAGQLVSAPARL
jgi:hypothetical protein